MKKKNIVIILFITMSLFLSFPSLTRALTVEDKIKRYASSTNRRFGEVWVVHRIRERPWLHNPMKCKCHERATSKLKVGDIRLKCDSFIRYAKETGDVVNVHKILWDIYKPTKITYAIVESQTFQNRRPPCDW